MTPVEPRPVPAVRCRGVTRTYAHDGSSVAAVTDVGLTVAPGTFTVLTGPSGSGKSTLLRLLACLDRPDAGRIEVAGVDVARASRRRRIRLRRERLGMLRQVPADNLLDHLTVREHLRFAAAMRSQRRDRRGADDAPLDELLAAFGLADRGDHQPHELSGGEQQRVAIAFAAVGPPAVLVADEPTGQLDHHTRDAVVAALAVLARRGTAIVAATHDPAVATRADQVVALRDGRVVEVRR